MEVQLSEKVKKDLRKVPDYIVRKLLTWVDLVEASGLAASRLSKGYHDEPLKGKKQGLRSIRLSKQWRAEYRHLSNGIELVIVEEVHPHDYKK